MRLEEVNALPAEAAAEAMMRCCGCAPLRCAAAVRARGLLAWHAWAVRASCDAIYGEEAGWRCHETSSRAVACCGAGERSKARLSAARQPGTRFRVSVPMTLPMGQIHSVERSHTP